MTGTEKQIAYATSLIEEIISTWKAPMQAAVREWADSKHAGWILDHQAGLVSICQGAAYIALIPSALATIPAEQHTAFWAECDKRVAYAVKYDPDLKTAYKALKSA